jgi:hypothetical protein
MCFSEAAMILVGIWGLVIAATGVILALWSYNPAIDAYLAWKFKRASRRRIQETDFCPCYSPVRKPK